MAGGDGRGAGGRGRGRRLQRGRARARRAAPAARSSALRHPGASCSAGLHDPWRIQRS